MRTGISLVCCLGLVLSLNGCAQRVDTAAEEARIQDVITQSFAALESQDWEMLAGLASDDWVVITAEGTTLDMAGMQRFFEHITDQRITISNIDVTISGDGQLAWATLEEHTQYKYDGVPGDDHALITTILEKGEEGWNVVHSHRTVEVEAET